MNNINTRIKSLKEESMQSLSITPDKKNEVLSEMKLLLTERKSDIFKANQKDLADAEKNGIPSPIYNRLIFDDKKLKDIVKGIDDLINMPEPCFRTVLKRQLDDGLTLEKITCPIGMIGVIFESRPDALVQIASLCLKTGNYVLLKGGSEAKHTNRALYDIIHTALINTGLPAGFVTLLETRDEITELLSCHDCIDLLIPRGSNEFVQYLMNNTKIPVMGHADGICHIYVDKHADFNNAIKIIVDAKTQYVAACNSVETVLVHSEIAETFLPKLAGALEKNNVKLLGYEIPKNIMDCEPATDEDFATEYLDYIVSVKIVKDTEHAVKHINKYGSHHTDCIITENDSESEKFMLNVDSSGVYRNCSTRFADGYRYGFGAEVGISTGKLHARGPVGLDGLLTYKYLLRGSGHIVSDYASGISEFHFKDL